ncbi:hypothetical protein GX51_08121 [Blastomyces parvus]|uniref:Uncharacterized protein n=1 Tax=Blastomyces parvus TaxID=2060905 RepID=A0A2B7WGN6_9EURO|nr:hypothetical protein GX51_08121 [Blastomyces parvus]
MSVSASEADIVFNRANVALARSQRLIASWLPPPTAEELAHAKTEEELQREEDEIFTPVPEKLGLGAPLPKTQQDGSANRTELSSNEKLRKQLLGKNYKKFTPSVPGTASRPDKKQQQHQHHRAKPQPASDDDEDEGRSSLGRNKRKRAEGRGGEATTTAATAAATATEPAAVADNPNDNGEDDQSDDGSAQRSTQRKKPASYLDELLSERSKKRKKKNKNKNNAS